MKYLSFLILFSSSLYSFGQDSGNWTEYDTLSNANGKLTLKVSDYKDSVFYSSFKTTIVDTTIEVKRAGFLWTKKFRIETHVFGPKWDYEYSETAKGTIICYDVLGISFVSKVE